MSEQHMTEQQASMREYLRARISRSQLLAAAGAGIAVALAPGVTGAQTPATESQADILDIRDTLEHFGVAFLSAGIKNATQLGLDANGGLLLDVVQAALAEEQFHADYLESQGAKTLTDTFNIPDPKLLTDPIAFFTALEMEEALEMASGIAAIREFSQTGNQALVQGFYQLGGTEGEHRVLARAALALLGSDGMPPNNKAFETDMVYYVRDALAIFASRGFLNGAGQKIQYPGRDAALALAGPMVAKVTQQTP